MSTNYDAMRRSVEQTYAQAVDYINRGQPRPAWLQKKIDAVLLMATDWTRGVALMIEALQDHMDALDAAEFIPYRPEAA